MLVTDLSERGGTGKMTSYWEEDVYAIVETKDQERITFAVRPTKQPNKIGILHGSLFLTCESLLEDLEGIQFKSDSAKQKRG